MVLDRYHQEGAGGGELLTPVTQMPIDIRADARKSKNFELADAIRNRLAAVGLTLKHKPDGTIWRRLRSPLSWPIKKKAKPP